MGRVIKAKDVDRTKIRKLGVKMARNHNKNPPQVDRNVLVRTRKNTIINPQ